MNNKLKEVFIKYLTEENIKNIFIERLKIYGTKDRKTIKKLIQNTKDPNKLIYVAFTWRKNNQVLFWSNIDTKWQIYYRNYKLEQLIS